MNRNFLVFLSGVLLILLIDCFNAKAEVFNVHTKAHEVYSFDTADSPKMIYNDGLIEITCNSSDLFFSPEDFVKITFGVIGNASSIEGVIEDSGWDEVSIFDINGRLVHNIVNSGSVINLESLESGAYVIKSGKLTFKIIKK